MSASNLPLCILAVLLAAGGCLARRTPGNFPDYTILPDKNQTLPPDEPLPPIADRRPHQIEAHGDVREDPYYWLRDDTREDPDVLEYLQAENKYLKAVMADTETLQDQLLREIRDVQDEDDGSVPQRRGNYFYYTRWEEGQQYAINCRRRIPEGMGPPSELDEMDESMPEEVLLDQNKEAEGHSFYSVKGPSVSPNEKLVMYGVDTSGAEEYTLHVKEIATGKSVLLEPIPGTSGDMQFALDNRTIFYVTENEKTRPSKVWRHTLGTSSAEDELVYHETDPSEWIMMWRSRDWKYIFMNTGAGTLFIDSANPDEGFQVVCRDKNCKTTHRDGYIFIRTWGIYNPNGQINVAPVSDPTNERVLIPHRKHIEIEGFELTRNFFVVYERKKGLMTATVYRLPEYGVAPEITGEGEPLEINETVYTMHSGGQGDFDSDILRIYYSSPKTPFTFLDCNMATGNRAVKKVFAVLGDFNSSNYETKRIWATATDDISRVFFDEEDATKIPISLVYRKDAVKLDGTDPLYLYVYGAYGVSRDMGFSWSRLSLLDRGFVYAIAHPRGGGELGTYWYLGGKMLNKKNTFTDLIDCAEELIRRDYSSPDKMVLYGGSAGGTAVGAVINMRPDLFKAAVLSVPFVDVLTSLLDDSLPLTVSGWSEWGDPHNRLFYNYIKSYSPVDNIEAKDYPHVLVTAGFNDPRVMYWEPAKYTAKLRALKTDDNWLLMKTDFSSGHMAASGLIDSYREMAMQYAFVMKALGLVPPQS